MRKPTIFVGSSSEGKEIAYKLGNQLEDVAEVRIWTEGIFNLSHRFFDSLTNARLHFDFAILVLSPDDNLQIRGNEHSVPRDNVIFECGFFMGHLGKDRTFLVYDKDKPLKLPTDLEGVSTASFRSSRQDGNLAAALRSVSETIRTSVSELGSIALSPPVEIKIGGDRLVVNRDSDGWSRPLHIRHIKDGISFPLGATEINIRYGRIQEAPPDSATGIVLPANEFFDDECIADTRSALGAFCQSHFSDRIPEFQGLVRANLQLSQSTPAEKRPGIVQNSYGVGTCVLIDRPFGSSYRIILAAVTTDRSGIRSEVSFLLKSLKEIVVTTNANRMSEIYLPLMGSGHGCLRPEASLFATLLGLSEALPLTGRNLKRVNVVVYKDPNSSRPPALTIPVMTNVVTSSASILM